jgi:hypothetical protein
MSHGRARPTRSLLRGSPSPSRPTHRRSGVHREEGDPRRCWSDEEERSPEGTSRIQCVYGFRGSRERRRMFAVIRMAGNGTTSEAEEIAAHFDFLPR